MLTGRDWVQDSFQETAPYGTSMWRLGSAIHGSAHFLKAVSHPAATSVF